MDLIFVIQSFAFVLAMSLDAFAASLANGVKGIKIPKKSVILISFICSLLVGLGIEIGGVAQDFLPGWITSFISFLILIILAFIKFFDFSIKRWIKVSNNSPKKDFYFLNVHFLLEVICDSTQADADLSKELSLKEAYALAIALSLDGFTAGISAGILGFNTIFMTFLSFVTGWGSIFLGSIFGRKIAAKTKIDLSWISGLILLIIAFMRI